MPKQCLCKFIPEIIQRLESLENEYTEHASEPVQAGDEQAIQTLLERSQYLDQIEQEIETSEKKNDEKMSELLKTSEQVSKLAKEIKQLKQQPEADSTNDDDAAEIQKALEAYTQTWVATNEVFKQLYNQLQPIFQLPQLKDSNTFIVEGIQQLGVGLLKLAPAFTQKK